MSIPKPGPLISLIFPFPKILSFIQHLTADLTNKSYDLIIITVPFPLSAILSIPLSPFATFSYEQTSFGILTPVNFLTPQDLHQGPSSTLPILMITSQ